ncbi:protein fantom isoform X2 [Phycodurus eques]|uniref:protein fantom isoform X2 n=1 Tax=Phycodurus eques TaxID=693459 RepID=UPI002ACEC9C9|nr:protein fantom isoform X2 [Phycodurus eques]
MSFLLDDTATHEPVKDISNPIRIAQGTGSVFPFLSSEAHNVRLRVGLSRVSRKELEDNFLQLHDDSLLLKQHIHQQEDKIRKLGTKLLRLVKDRRRMEQLAAGGMPPAPGRRDAEEEDLMDEFQEKVRALEADNERLKQRLFVAKRQQRPVSSATRSPLVRGQTRVASAPRKHDDASSPSLTPPRHRRSSAGDERPPTGQPMASLHALLEEAREKTQNLENVIESQERRIAQLEEEKHVTLQQQNKSELRSQINNNVTMIKLQKQLAERCAAMMELEERFLQLQESQHTQKACYDTAAAKMAELMSQLRDERAKGVEIRTQLQTAQLAHAKTQQLQDRVDEVEQEKELLKEHNEKLLNSMFDGPQPQRWSVQEQQLQQHIAHLEEALQADLQDKKKILEQVKVEKDARDKLTEEKRKLEDQVAQQKHETDELRLRVDVYRGARNSQLDGELSFLQEVQDERQDAHVETIEELEKVRQLLALESRISSDLKAELDSVQKKMECDKRSHAQQLEHQLQMLAAKDAKMHKLEAQLQDVAYGTRSVVVAADAPDENRSPPLERGENLVEVQIVGATLSAAALEALSDPVPSTFCTYAFYLFELHSTPVATGSVPRYGFTSRYVVSVDQDFLEYVGKRQLRVEMHQALGLRWKTVASAALDLRRLLRDGAVAGTLPLFGSSGEDSSFGSVDYWIKLRHPIGESERLLAAGGHDEQHYWAWLHCSSSTMMTIWRPALRRSCWWRCTAAAACAPDARRYPVPTWSTSSSTFRTIPPPPCTIAASPASEMSGPSPWRRIAHWSATSGRKRSACTCSTTRSRRWMRIWAKPPFLWRRCSRTATSQAPLTSTTHRVATLARLTSRSNGSHLSTKAPKFSRPRMSRQRRGQAAHWKARKAVPPSCPCRALEARHRWRASLTPASFSPQVAAPAPKKFQSKDELVAKKVTFRETLPPDSQAAPAKLEEDEDDEESLISEGQVLLPHPTFTSDPQHHLPHGGGEVESSCGHDAGPCSQSDDDGDDDFQRRATRESRRVRVEVTSLSLEAESRLYRDINVVRLFVEFAFLDLPTEETPVSLPKPPPGKSVSFNFSKVFPVDTASGASRRQLLKDVLRGRKADMERIRFTVVSEPPVEEEQERECEDVGVAFLNIPDLMTQPHDVAHLHLRVVDVEDGVSLLGSLRVTFEGVQTLRALLDEAGGEISVSPSAAL